MPKVKEYTLREVAAQVGRSYFTMYRHYKNGKLTARRVDAFGHAWFTQEAIDAWQAQNRMGRPKTKRKYVRRPKPTPDT